VKTTEEDGITDDEDEAEGEFGTPAAEADTIDDQKAHNQLAPRHVTAARVVKQGSRFVDGEEDEDEEVAAKRGSRFDDEWEEGCSKGGELPAARVGQSGEGGGVPGVAGSDDEGVSAKGESVRGELTDRPRLAAGQLFGDDE
jgi:hypothetical protein